MGQLAIAVEAGVLATFDLTIVGGVDFARSPTPRLPNGIRANSTILFPELARDSRAQSGDFPCGMNRHWHLVLRPFRP